jgi:hypothetical protein
MAWNDYGRMAKISVRTSNLLHWFPPQSTINKGGSASHLEPGKSGITLPGEFSKSQGQKLWQDDQHEVTDDAYCDQKVRMAPMEKLLPPGGNLYIR